MLRAVQRAVARPVHCLQVSNLAFLPSIPCLWSQLSIGDHLFAHIHIIRTVLLSAYGEE